MNGKRKGSQWERVISTMLSIWWTNGDRDDVFWRSSNSGGRSTVRGKSGKKSDLHCGDICATDPIGQPLLQYCSIEVKRGYNKATIHDLLDRSKHAKAQMYEEWIAQAERDRVRSGAIHWMIIHQRDRREAMVYVPESFASSLKINNWTAWLSVECYTGFIVALPLKQFLTIVRPASIINRLVDEKNK